MEIIQFILITLSLATLAIQVVISSLSEKVKKSLYIDRPYRLNPLTNIYFWFSFTGLNWGILLSPVIFLLVTMFKIHKFFSEMLDCPYCVGFHLGWIVYYFYLGMPLLTALLYAPIVILATVIVDKIMSI